MLNLVYSNYRNSYYEIRAELRAESGRRHTPGEVTRTGQFTSYRIS